MAWSVSSGGGALNSVSTVTGADDSTRIEWTLGTAAGTHSVRVTAADLPAVTFTATALADTVPPVLTALAIAPDTVRIVGDPVPVRFTFTVTDAATGVHLAGVMLVGPGPNQGRGCQSLTLIEGTAAHGKLACSVVLSEFSAPGDLTITEVWLQDVAGNLRLYTTEQLRQAGLPDRVTVIR